MAIALHNTPMNKNVSAATASAQAETDPPLSKRELILHSASELFLGSGFEGTSMDQVAVNAGVSKQTVYSHFGSKEALFTAVIESKCQRHAITGDLFDINRPVHDVLVELAEHFTDLILSPEAINLHRICIAGGEKYSQIARLFWQAGPSWLQREFAGYLDKKQADGAVNIGNTLHAAQQFLYMLKGEAHLRLLLNLEEPVEKAALDDYIGNCVALFEKAYLS